MVYYQAIKKKDILYKPKSYIWGIFGGIFPI